MTLLTTRYAVQILGTPAGKGSMTCKSKHAKGMHQNLQPVNEHELKRWTALVKKAGLALPVSGLVGPIGVELTITVERPRSHYRTGRNAHLLRDDAPVWPVLVGTGDADKYGRACLDALQRGKPGNPGAGVFIDDAQVVELVTRKVYPDTPGVSDRLPRPGCVIRIYPIEARDALPFSQEG